MISTVPPMRNRLQTYIVLEMPPLPLRDSYAYVYGDIPELRDIRGRIVGLLERISGFSGFGLLLFPGLLLKKSVSPEGEGLTALEEPLSMEYKDGLELAASSCKVK